MYRHLTDNLNSENKKTIETKPKQVIFAWNYLEWGGAQIYFLGIASRIKNRTNIKFVFPKATSRQFIDFCDNRQIPYDLIDNFTDLQPATTLKRKVQRHWNKIRSELKLLKFLKKYDFTDSILHIEFAPWQSFFALFRLCLRTQVFMTMHNSLPQVAKWRFLLWKLKFALITQFKNFHIFASNVNAKNSLKPLVSGKFFDKVKVTYTNVNPDEVETALNSKIDSVELSQRFGLPIDKFLVLCLGQFIDRKGRWTFLEAAQKINNNDKDVVFVWISNSKLTAEESAKIESYRLGNNFFLIKSEEVGSEHLDLMKFLRMADVFTLPSFVEGLPISLLEAMAMGIPSISTDINAIPEAVKNLETGILIEAGNSDALAGAIELLINDGTLRQKISQNGRKFVLENFNEKTVAEIAFESYQSAFD